MIEKEVRKNDKGLKTTNIYKLDPLIDTLKDISFRYKNVYKGGKKKWWLKSYRLELLQILAKILKNMFY